MQAEGGVRVQFPDFCEFEPYLREIEQDLIRSASSHTVYQLKDKSPESVSAFASDMAAKTLAAANEMAMGYLAAYHQFLSDYFSGQASE